MSVMPASAADPAAEGPFVPVLHLLRAHEHIWALRDVEYDNGFSLNRFECESCSAVRFT